MAISNSILLVLTLHFVADFTLQGLFKNLKCKDWWIRELHELNYCVYHGSKYKHDYKCALILHGLYWSLVTYAPIWYFASDWTAGAAVAVNACVHAVIDHFKCNRYALNLVEDQVLHFMQITITWALFN